MTDKEISSIGTQLCYCFHANRSAAKPVNLILTGIGPKIKEAICKMQGDKWPIKMHEKECYEAYDTDIKKLVYLTGDSENVLEKLDDDKIYIIGGLVDRNRHKLCTYKKASEHGIATARFPIRENIDLCSSTILTIVHVMQIMLLLRTNPDWKAILQQVIPKRKIVTEEEKKEESEEEEKKEC